MSEIRASEPPAAGGLRRELTLAALVATAVCTVIGGGINVLTIEIQGKVPGIGALVPLAFALGALPAVFTALGYAILSSAMPRAGGGYIYISRGLHPYVGFIATFSKWFGLSATAGVIAYIDVSLLRAAAMYAHLDGVVAFLDLPAVRLWLPLALVWLFWWVNLVGVRTYGIIIVALMVLMFAGGAVVIVAGLLASPERWLAAAEQSGHWGPVQQTLQANPYAQAGIFELLRAISVLFFAYIGFDTLSQAGGEARSPVRLLPRAFVIATATITAYYILFSAAVYHCVPWQWIVGALTVERAALSVPEVIGVLLPPWLAVFVALMAAVTLANDIPPILLSVSRLFFAWAQDGIFPPALAAINRRFATPHWALTASALVATLVVIECHFHGFFMGVDITVIALCFTYLMVGLTVLTLPRRNPHLYGQVAFLRQRGAQVLVALLCVLTITPLLLLQLHGDIQSTVGAVNEAIAQGQGVGEALPAALSRSTTALWVAVMLVGTLTFLAMWKVRSRSGQDLREVFATLPAESEDDPQASG